MHTALDDTDSPLEAREGQPDQALCPRCGGVVILRQRRRSHSYPGVTYFWRHQDRENAGCPARFETTLKKGKANWCHIQNVEPPE